jgi:integrase
MATLAFQNTILIVKYLYDNNGSWYYQRPVPKDLQHRLGLKKLTEKIDLSKGNVDIQALRIANSHTKLFKDLREDPDLVISEQKVAAISLMAIHGLKPGDGNKFASIPSEALKKLPYIDTQPHLHDFHDSLERLSQNHTELTYAQEMALKALREPLPVLLSEMPTIYLEHHNKGKDKDHIEKTWEYWKKFMSFTGDKAAESITRDIAREYKNHRESLGLKTASVKKDLAIVKAIFNKCILEIPLKMTNPFEKLTISGLEKDAEKRIPFTNDELKKIYQACVAQDDDIRRIVICTLATGARLGEIVGLRKKDVHLDAEVPYIQIAEYGNKTVKTRNSNRLIPLLPQAIKALKKQLSNETNEMLFSRYNDGITKPDADAASATINKWLKTTFKTSKTTHSLRHSAEDLLRYADVTEDIREELTGRGKQTMSDRYGLGHAMNTKKTALTKAFKPIFT